LDILNAMPAEVLLFGK